MLSLKLTHLKMEGMLIIQVFKGVKTLLGLLEPFNFVLINFHNHICFSKTLMVLTLLPRYLRTVEELQRVDLQDISREEKLAFFINLYNMMVIHGILVWGYPVGALERRKLLGEFKYVVGGCTYSLSVIANGILRANQRPPYNITRPFGMKDRRAKVIWCDAVLRGL